jgi:hypothetical protein
MPQLISLRDLLVLLGSAEYTIFTPSGRKVGAFHLKSDVVYLLRSEKEQTARRIAVIDR